VARCRLPRAEPRLRGFALFGFSRRGTKAQAEQREAS